MSLLALAFIAAVSTRAGDPDCHPLADPKHLPGVDVVVDSADLLRRLQAIDTSGGREVIVGILLSRPPTGSTFAGPPAQAELVLAGVLASLRPASKASPQAFRLHVQLGPTPSIAVERSVLCNPESLDAQTSVRVPFAVGVVVAEGGSMPSATSPRPRSISPRMRIDKDGQVVEVSIGSGSGVPEVDQKVTEMIRAQRYRPALLDGRPVEVWLSGSRIELVP